MGHTDPVNVETGRQNMFESTSDKQSPEGHGYFPGETADQT